jgi:hypothetical protein
MYATYKGNTYAYVMGFGGLGEGNSLCFGDMTRHSGGFAWRINGSWQYLNGIQIAINKWQHHALVRYGNTLTHYVDGVAATSGSGTIYIAPDYIGQVPTAPAPNDGTCTAGQNTYTYTQTSSGASYTLTFCLGAITGGTPAGTHTLSPSGIQ